jgi:hypothetical protein
VPFGCHLHIASDHGGRWWFCLNNLDIGLIESTKINWNN